MKANILSLAVWLAAQATIAQPTINIETYATGFTNSITDMAFAPDDRLYVTEQNGHVRLFTGGVLLPKPFLDITNKITTGEEQGLLGITFSPDFLTDGYFYLNYTNKTDTGNTIIARYHVSNNPDSADVASEEVLLEVRQPYKNQNGGCLKFGNDGYLYIALGDGGFGGDPANRAQNLDSLLGKFLRVDVSGSGAYAIPLTNPYVGANGRDEIWAYGLRNPWRFSFDRLTHDLWITDVGQDSLEEVNFQPANSNGGENYGWRCYEGHLPYNTSSCALPSAYQMPVYDYNHSSGGCSVTGGFVYRGTQYTAMYGYYLFADWCSGDVYTLTTDGNFTYNHAGHFNDKFFTTFGEDNNGELYVADNETHSIYHIVAEPNSVETVSGKSGLLVYPTPTSGLLNCRLNTVQQDNVSFTLTNCMGQVVYSAKYHTLPGLNTIGIEVTDYPQGIYTLHYYSQSGQVGFTSVAKK